MRTTLRSSVVLAVFTVVACGVPEAELDERATSSGELATSVEPAPGSGETCQHEHGGDNEYFQEVRRQKRVLRTYSTAEAIEGSGRYEGGITLLPPIGPGETGTATAGSCSTSGGSVTVGGELTVSGGVSIFGWGAEAGMTLSAGGEYAFEHQCTSGLVGTLTGPKACIDVNGAWSMDYTITNKQDVETWEERRMCRKCRATCIHVCSGFICGPWAGVTGSSQRSTEETGSTKVTVSTPIAGVFCQSGNTYPTAPLDPNGKPWK